MNQELILWIFGFIITGACGGLLGLAKAGWSINDGIQEWQSAMLARVVRLETTISMFNEKAAAILHSPHTPELDALLEKLAMSYKQNLDMPESDWLELLLRTEEIENDLTLPKGERFLAAMTATTCRLRLGLTGESAGDTL
jgi:hypothetical protein